MAGNSTASTPIISAQFAMADFSRNTLPIHITSVSAERFDERSTPCCLSRMMTHGIEFCEQVGELKISSFRTPHDSRMSVGYRIEFFDGEQKRAIGFATDIGYISDEIRENLRGCEAVVLESNHDLDMLMTGPYPRDLKLRVASKRGHLSNRECADFAIELAESGTRGILLAHLSKENNEPTLALEESERALGGLGVCVCVADPDLPVELKIFDGEDAEYAEREVYNPWNA